MNAAAVVTPVQKGAEALDRLVPGWAQRINVDILDMQETTYCIVGQLWPSQGWLYAARDFCRLIDPEHAETYQVMTFDDFNNNDAVMVEHGFEIHSSTPNDAFDNAYQALAHLWRVEISKRV